MKENLFRRQKINGGESRRDSKKKSPKESPDSNDTTLLVDCSALIHAAFHTFGVLSYNGEPTGIIYGFLRSLLKLAIKFKTNDFILCWDSGTGHRLQRYPAYKENRAPAALSEEEKADRRERVLQGSRLTTRVIPNLGFRNSFIQPGFEADDILAYWANKLKDKGTRVIMITNDSDMYQCLNDCSIYNPTTKKSFTKVDFIKKYNVKPEQWAMAKAIGGCSGDNVEGIEGVGDPKSQSSKALKYIRGELTSGRIYERIENGEFIINRNLQLVALPYQDIPLTRMIRKRNKYNRRGFLQTFDKYHFISFLKTDSFIKWERAFLQ